MNGYLPFPNERIAVVAITRHGIRLACRVAAAFPGASLFAPERFAAEVTGLAPGSAHFFQGKTGDQIPALFAGFDGIICIVSLGAVVRLIAPHLKDKETDPGIVVMDEAGRFSIPALSGHMGGANALAQRLAETMGAVAVLTTASDVRETLAVDILGRELGWRIEAPKDNITRACAAAVNEDPVAFVQEAGARNWWTRPVPLPANIRLFERLEDIAPDAFSMVLWVSRREVPPALASALAGKLVIYRPPEGAAMKVALGLGCDRGTPSATIAAAIDDALAQSGAALADVVAVASIDLKRDEAGLIELARKYGWNVAFYRADELARVEVPNPSATVLRHTGTPSVSEAAALLAAGATMDKLLVEKIRRRGADGRNATVSIAAMSE